jgi:predicted Zn-dependent protease
VTHNDFTCCIRPVAQSRPYSRALEEEADHVGMVILARACLDPSVVPDSLKALSKDQEEEWDELDTVSRHFSTPDLDRV